MRYHLARMGQDDWLVTFPDTHAFGNAILNVTWSFLMARERGLTLCMQPLQPERFSALWRLRCQGVRSAEPTAACLGSVEAGADDAPDSRPQQPILGLNVRRLLVEAPLDVSLSEADEREVAPVAASLGLTSNSPIVALHVREAGYKPSQGVEDRGKDAVRNAALQSYIPAIDWLVSRGFLVARIGDASMTPMRRAGVVDLATRPERSLALELLAVKRSRFLIATDSGPYNLSFLLNVPSLLTNVTHFLGAYPLRAADRYMLRRAYDARDGHELTLAEMLTPHHLKFRFDSAHVRFDDNTADDIVAGVQEMVQNTAEDPTSEQLGIRAAISEFLASDYGRRKLKLGATGASEPYFVGLGRHTKTCAEHLLNPSWTPG
jgi:putative glycosyltransferase (TIGR04372 family)